MRRGRRLCPAVAMALALAGSGGAASPRHAQQASPAQTSASAISGVVVDASTREAVGEAIVSLTLGGGAGFRRQQTDEKGRFVFVGLQPGSYALTVAKAGYDEGHPGPLVMAGRGRLFVEPGAWLRDLQIELTKLAAIEGRIVDDTGQPMVGVAVRALRRFRVGGRAAIAVGVIARSDDRGSYRLSGLAGGEYLVMVPSVQQAVGDVRAERTPWRFDVTGTVLSNYPVASASSTDTRFAYPPTFFPSASDLSAALPILVARGEVRRGADMTLVQRPVRRVCGRVEAAGRSTQGYVLRMMPRGLEATGEGSEVATSPVDARGAFCFPGVPPGAYTLLAPGPSFEFTFGAESPAPSSVDGLPATPGIGRIGATATGVEVAGARGIRFATHAAQTLVDDYAGSTRDDVVVADTDINDLVVNAEAAGTISGHVTYVDLVGRPPLGSAEIAAADGDPLRGVRFARLSTSSDAFLARALPPGDYAIRFPSADLTLVSIVADGVDVSGRAVPVRSGQATRVEIVMSGARTELSGTVANRNGALVPAAVVAFPTDDARWQNYGLNPTWIRAVSSGDGRYRLPRLRPGSYYVIAVDPVDADGWTEPAFLRAHVGRAVRVEIKLGDLKVQPLVINP